MAKRQTDIAPIASNSFPIDEIIESNPRYTRREMLGITGMAGMASIAGMAGLTALINTAAGAAPQIQQKRPRIACLVSFWGAP